MRAGALISAVAHAIMLTLFLLGTAKPYDAAPTETVSVDLVPSEEAPPDPAKIEPDKPEPQKPPEPELTVVLPTFSPTRPSATAVAPTSTPKQSAPALSAAAPAKATAPAKAEAPAKTAPATPAPATPPQAGPTPAASAPAQPQPPAAQKPDPSIFDPASIPKLMELTPRSAPEAPTFAFDAQAEVSADLSREDVAAFKAHLKKCLKLPAGVDPSSRRRVVVRVFLKPDGALASEPMLIEASASREGPAMVKAAQEALRQCQPYGFLPADKYPEWKVLDLTLSPQDMGGG